MKQVVDQILEGNYLCEIGSLDFSCAKIEIELMQGETVPGSFLIRGEHTDIVEGYVYSTDYRMEVLTPDFQGSESEISFLFHADGVEEGECVKGAFRVVSRQGEYALPFVVNCEPERVLSSMGPIKNLFHFANLAKSNWDEALKLFYSDRFPGIFSGSEARYLPYYTGLSEIKDHEQNMEEFLICVGKKQHVDFRAEKSRLELECPYDSGEPFANEITVTRSGWGYTVLNVECDGEFLTSQRYLLTEDDFIGNYARFTVLVDPGKLHNGENHGKIVLFNSYTSFQIDVVVRCGIAHVISHTDITYRRTVVELMKCYESFRTKKLSLPGWLKESGQLVEKLIALDENDVAARLFKTQLLITQDRQSEAGWLLSHAGDMMESQGVVSDELRAYYMYLSTLLSRDEEQIRQVSREVEILYKHNPDSWRIAWLLLYLSDELSNLPAAKLQLLERQFDRGGVSRVLYIEALQILNNTPTLLRRIGRFEEQVLYYGITREYLSPEVAERFLEILDARKEYSPVLCMTLEKLYEKRKDVRIVQEMCRLYAKEGILGDKALLWYERGVEHQLRITNLYELYMACLDPEEKRKLPKAAVLYFFYQNNLDYERSAILYNYVLGNKVMFEEIYDKYYLKAREFALEQLEKGRINRNLAQLYERILPPEEVTEQIAQKLQKLVFAARVRVEDGRMKKVLVYFEGSTCAQEAPVTNKEACVYLYGDDYCILLEDAFGNRFASESGYTLERYMTSAAYLSSLVQFKHKDPGFDLYLLKERDTGDAYSDGLAGRALRLCGWKYLDNGLRKRIGLRLIRQFYETERLDKLQEILDIICAQDLSLAERTEVIRYLILSGDCTVSYEWIRQCGPYFVDANSLSRLIGKLVLDEAAKNDLAVVSSAVYLFRRGKHNPTILEYLGTRAVGSSKDLRDIWKELRANGLDCTALEERLLIQLMYTGSYVGEKADIYLDYYHNSNAGEVARAFLIQSCYEFFAREKITDGSIIATILDYYKWNAPLPKVCKLAFLKFYAENPEEIHREINGALDVFLREMLADRMHFSFYQNLKLQRPLLGELADKQIVEYRTRPGGQAKIHYVILQEDGEEQQEYLTENMRDVFGGVCCKEFVLFFGETLQYYITEEIDGEEQLTESGNLQCGDAGADPSEGKFGMINDMVISRSMQDYETLDSELEAYYFKEYCSESLFVLH